MTPHQLKTLHNIAKRYRKQENLPLGFVTLVGSFFGHCKPEPDGWLLRLDRPSAFIPGCFAVSPSGEVFIAEGGNDYDGAKAWVRVSPLPGQESPGARLAAAAEADQVEGTCLDVAPARLPAPNGKRSAVGAGSRAGAIVFGVQGLSSAPAPAFPVPVGNTGTEFKNGVVHA